METSNNLPLSSIALKIKEAHDIILTTHRQCDGDGLGCELALFFVLKKMGKNVKIINVDSTPKKYRFLNPDHFIQYYDSNPHLPIKTDLILVFDTNDERLLEPLFTPLKELTTKIVFIDHHPLLQKGPRPQENSSHIDMHAASTGEVVYNLIQLLGVTLDATIAKSLYTSITFDTQLYRFIRSSPRSHEIAAELMAHPFDTEEIHRHLFSHQTVNKVAFMAKVFSELQYHCNGRLALTIVTLSDLKNFKLDFDEVRDVTDQIMSIESVEVALVIRQDKPNQMKISLRSKGIIEVLSAAESVGGGGHWYASGGSFVGSLEALEKQLLNHLKKQMEEADRLIHKKAE